jgi:hypothetical protein
VEPGPGSCRHRIKMHWQLKTYVEIVVHEHSDGAEARGGESDDELHLHDERVVDGARAGARGVARLAELHGGQHESEQRGGAQRHGEPGSVLRPRHPRGAVPAGVHPEHGGADAEQHQRVHGEGREPLPHEEQREAGREGQLRGDEDGGGGHGQVGQAVGVEQVIEAHQDADHHGLRQEPRRHEEEERVGAGLCGRRRAVDDDAAAATTEGEVERDEQERGAGGLEEAGEPLAVAAVEEVGAEEERAPGRADDHEDEVDDEDRVAERPCGGADLAVMAFAWLRRWRFDLHDAAVMLELLDKGRNPAVGAPTEMEKKSIL